jgi:hypothetical protein
LSQERSFQVYLAKTSVLTAGRRSAESLENAFIDSAKFHESDRAWEPGFSDAPHWKKQTGPQHALLTLGVLKKYVVMAGP